MREFSLHFLSISSFSLHFLFISSFSLHFLGARLQGSSGLRHPALYSNFYTTSGCDSCDKYEVCLSAFFGTEIKKGLWVSETSQSHTSTVPQWCLDSTASQHRLDLGVSAALQMTGKKVVLPCTFLSNLGYFWGQMGIIKVARNVDSKTHVKK